MKYAKIKRSYFLFTIFFTLLSINASAQNIEKLYKRGIETFYKEDFEGAITYFEQIENTGRTYKDTKYRLEIARLLLKKNRERPLTTIQKFEETKARSDKFFYYWMGRIYENRYMFAEAVDSWHKFLDRKGFKSEEVVKETRDFIEEAKVLLEEFDNPDNYEIHKLEAPINSKYAELSPAFFTEKNELLFTSNRLDPEGDIFSVFHSKYEDGQWSDPTPLKNMGTFERNNANVEVVNEDGKFFLFRDVKKGDLYFSEPAGNNKWTDPVEFDSKITSTHLESHFYINEHEDRIIFSSDNWKNELDLMESFKDPSTGKWSKPQLLSWLINSTYNEDSPFLSADEKTLYFCSDRPGGVGGLDVYKSEIDEESGTWKEPVNLGWPINSPDDDLHFKLNPDGRSGYFASNRIHAEGDYDIFFFWHVEKTRIEGKVVNAVTKEPITDAEIRFNPTQYLDEYFRSPLDSSGAFSSKIIANETFKVEVIRGLDTLAQHFVQVVDKEGEFTTHYHDFYVFPEDMSDAEVASMKIALYGSNTPVASKTPYVQPDVPVVAPPAVAQVTKEPEEKIEEPEQQPEKEIEAEPEPVIAEPEPQPKKTSVSNVGHQSGNSRKAILHNIYFKFGTSQMTDESEPVLMELLTVLKNNPSLRIEIAGHTDNIGSAQNNLMISEKRAEAVKKWLTKKGIDPDRLVTKGYGESKPLASNDDEINGRELNRRIEINVIN